MSVGVGTSERSFLSARINGYDFVIATTQASINTGLKTFLADDDQPTLDLCFLVDQQQNPTIMVTLEEFLKRTGGVNPFDIPDGTDPQDPRVQRVSQERFNVGLRLRLGLPPGIIPNRLPDVLSLRDAANNVTFRLFCSELVIIQNTPGSIWGGGSWTRMSQPHGEAWFFETFVDLVVDNLNNDLSGSKYLERRPEVKEQLKRQIDRNLSGTAFSLHQLLFDLNTTVLQTMPTIHGVDRGSAAHAVLQQFFVSVYSETARENGWPLLSITAVTQEPDPSQLELTSFDRQVTRFRPPGANTQEANTLDHVCVINNRPQPPTYNFDWNWVALTSVAHLSGVISINRNTMAAYMRDQLLAVVPSGCMKMETWVDASWYFHVRYSWRVTPWQRPTPTITQAGPDVLRIEYSSTSSAEDQQALIYGALRLKHNYRCDLRFQGNMVNVTQVITVNCFAQFMNTWDELDIQHNTITDMYFLSVDQGGSMRMQNINHSNIDRSQNPSNSGFINFFTGINDLVNDIKAHVSRVDRVRLSDRPLNSVPNFVFPGSRVFTYTDVNYSQHQDLVSRITYVDPRNARARNPQNSTLGFKITHTSDLLENYVQGEIVAPLSKFEALQSDQGNGHAVLFAVDSNNVFQAFQEESGETSTGWRVSDLSSHVITRQFAEDPTAHVSTFGVSQSALEGVINMAIAVKAQRSDHLLISLANSCSNLSWLEFPTWTMVPFDEPSHLMKPIKIADIMFAETSDNERYLVVDIDVNPEARRKDIVRFHIDIKKSKGHYWVKHDLPVDIENGNYQSVIGRTANGFVDGVYTIGTSGGGAQFIYQPIINVFGAGPPLPIRLGLPGGRLPTALAALRNSDKTQTRLYASTDVYTIGQSTLYRFPADRQRDGVVGEVVLENPIFSGTNVLRAMMNDGVTTIWGKNASNQVYYVSCLSANVADPNAWSAPVPILTGVEQMSSYLNKVDGGNTIFTAGGGKLTMITQASDTASKVWRPQAIQLSETPRQKLHTFTSYTTTIHLLDKDDQPVVDSLLSLWADSHTPVYINGLYYVLGKTSIEVPTDPSGSITIIEATEDLNASIISVSLPRDSITTVINPMDKSFDKIASLDTAQSLRNANYTSETVAGGTLGPVKTEPLVDPSTSQGDVNAVAGNMKDLREAYDNVKAPQRTGKLFFHDEDVVAVVPSTYFQDGDEGRSLSGIAIAIGDLFQWLKSGIRALIRVIRDAATGAWHFIAEIAGKVYRAVLNAADAVVGALEWLFDAIKTGIRALVQFVQFLFDWDDIRRTKQVLHNVVKLFLTHQVDQIETARVGFNARIDEVGDSIATWGGITDWSPLGPVADGPASQSSDNPAEGHTSGSLLFANHLENQAKSIEVEGSLADLQAESLDEAESLITILLDAISDQGEVLSGVYSELQTLASQFSSLSVGDFLKGLAAILAKGMLSSVQVVVDALFRVLASLASSALSLLDAKLYIPVISDILRLIGVPQISFLDLLTWVAAVGFTVVYKIANRSAPFEDNGDTRALISASSWGELQKIVFNSSSLLASQASEKSKELELAGPYGAMSELQKILHITGHATSGFMIFSTNFVSGLEAAALTGTNPFSTLATVAGVIISGTHAMADFLVPRYPVENTAVGIVETAVTVAGVLNSVLFSGPVQRRLAVSSTKFNGLATGDGRATSAIIDSILVIPAMVVMGWHFYELSSKPAGKEKSSAILCRVQELTDGVSRISYTVAVNDKNPATKPFSIIAMAVANVVGAGLNTATSFLVE